MDEENPYLQRDESGDNSGDITAQVLPVQTHTVTFKCVGTNHDPARQDVLSDVSQALRQGDIVAARAEPEPTNQYDSDAIALLLHWKDKWHTIGYVVHECLDHVHHALQQK